MSDIKKGRSQVLFKYLPGSIFSEKGVWFKASSLNLKELQGNTDHLLDIVFDFVDNWTINNDLDIKLFPRQEHMYYFAELEEVNFELFPLVFYCTECRNVHPYGSLKQLQSQNTRLVCEFCKNGRLRQYPYALVHKNGDIQPLKVTPNPNGSSWKAKYDGIRMIDTRSFTTATWYQYKKKQHISELGTRYTRMPIAQSMRHRVMGGTHLSEGDIYYPALRSFVNLEQEVFQKRKEHESFAYYQIGALLEIPSVDLNSYAENFNKKENELQILYNKASDVEKQMLLQLAKSQNINLNSNDDVIIQEVNNLFQMQIPVDKINQDRSLHEFIYTWLESDAVSINHRIIEARNAKDIIGETAFLEAQHHLQLFGFEEVLLIENFPVLMMAIGYTRKSFDRRQAILNPIRQRIKEREKIVLPVLKNENEAVVFKLNSNRVLAWLVLNNWIPTPIVNKITGHYSHAYIYQFCEFSKFSKEDLSQFKPSDYLNEKEILATVMIFRLLHSYTHGLFQAGKAVLGLDIDSLSEYLFPSSLATAIYVTKLEGGGMGALTAAFDNDLARWISGLYDKSNSCLYDPVCHEHSGACHACMFLKFSCAHFNHGVSRNLLIDGIDPDYDPSKNIIGFFSPRVSELLKEWGCDIN